MRAVIDSSVAIASVLPEPHQAKAIQFLDDFRVGLHDLLAPDIYPIETLNGLAKAERQKRIRNAYPLWQGIMADSPVYHPHFALLPRVYAISAQILSAVYDCVYVCLAEKEGCELVTADDGLVQNLQTRFPFVLHLKDLP
jgi:predicted nucleic acid-binding protein